MNFQYFIQNLTDLLKEDLLFVLLSVVVLVMALIAVLCKDLTRSALALLSCFGGIALLYFSLGAHFIAIAQILVYAVGITLIILFAIMLIRNTSDSYNTLNSEKRNAFLITSGISSFLVFFVFFTSIYNSQPGLDMLTNICSQVKSQLGTAEASIVQLGARLLQEQLLAFELISLLLLVAFISAIVLANRQKKTTTQ